MIRLVNGVRISQRRITKTIRCGKRRNHAHIASECPLFSLKGALRKIAQINPYIHEEKDKLVLKSEGSLATKSNTFNENDEENKNEWKNLTFQIIVSDSFPQGYGASTATSKLLFIRF